MKKIGVLRLCLILIIFLLIYLCIQLSQFDISESIEANEYPLTGFRINNTGGKDQVYTYEILLDDEKFGENNVLLNRFNSFNYSIYPAVFWRNSNLTVSIYRGVFDKKKLIYNKTYYLEKIDPEKLPPQDLENINCYSIPLQVTPYSYRDVDVYSLGAPAFHHYALSIFREKINRPISYIRFDLHGDDTPFENELKSSAKIKTIWSNHSKSFYNFTTVEEIFGLFNTSYLICGSYMINIQTNDNVKNVFWVVTKDFSDRIDYLVIKPTWMRIENITYSTNYEIYIFSTFEDASAYILQNSERNIVIDIDADITEGYFTSYGVGSLTSKQLMEFINMTFRSRKIEYIVVAGDERFQKNIQIK